MKKWLANTLAQLARKLGYTDDEWQSIYSSLEMEYNRLSSKYFEAEDKIAQYEKKFYYDYPKMNNCVDIAIIYAGVHAENPEILLIKRGSEPFKKSVRFARWIRQHG